MSYFKKLLHGLAWTTILRASVRGVTIIRLTILARVIGLTADQFGLFGVVTIVLGLLEIFTETGINVFILQEGKDWEKYVSTAWLISIIRGLIIGSGLFLTRNLVADFFAFPQAAELIMFSSLVPIIRGFINPACIRFLKELKFNSEFWYRTSILFVEAVATITITAITRSPLGLVLGLIISAFFETVLSFVVIRPWPNLKYSARLGREILSRGRWVTAFGIFDYVLTNIDNVLVGKVLGSSALGIYQNAYKVSTVPLTEVNDIVYKTTFPIFVDMTNTSRQVQKQTVFKTVLSTLGIMLPLSFAVFLLAHQIVQILLGPSWLVAVPVVKTLAFLGLIRGVSSSWNAIFMAEKKQQYVSIVTIFQTLLLSSLLIPFINRYAINGAAIAALLAAILTLPLTAFCVYRLAKLRW